jgi:hypothetical protein
MKKSLVLALFFFAAVGLRAQYSSVNAILDRLEERRGVNQNLSNVNIDDKKFVLIKDFDDHTERSFLVIKGNQATYIEIFDDKSTGESVSNVFSGDIVRSKHNIISLRANLLEGKPIPIAVTKTFLMTKQKKILYLIDINSRERWIDEISIIKK